MSSLAPKQSDNISYERPVGAAPSVLQAVLGVAGGMLQDHMDTQAAQRGNMSAADRKNEALGPIFEEMNNIYERSDLPPDRKAREINRLAIQAKIAYPAYDSDISTFQGTALGIDPGEGDSLRVSMDARQEFNKTAMGQAALASIMRPGQSTDLDESQNILYDAAVNRWLATQGEIESLAQSQQIDEVKWRKLSPAMTEQAIEMAAGLAVSATTDPELRANPELGFNILNDAITQTRESVRSQMLAAGMDPAFIDSKIDSAVKPLLNLQSQWKDDAKTPGLVLDAFEKAGQLDVTRRLMEVTTAAADPAMRQMMYQMWIDKNVTGENVDSILGGLDEMAKGGDFDSFKLTVDVMPGPKEATQPGVTTVSPEKITEWRTKSKETPGFLQEKFSGAAAVLSRADINTPEGISQVRTGLQHMVIAAEAYEGPLGEGTLRTIFSPANITKFKALGDEGESMITNMIMSQVRQNRNLVANSSALLSDQRIRVENGRFIAEKKSFMGDTWGPISPGSDMQKSVNSINALMAASKQFPGVKDAVTKSVNWLYNGVEPTPDMLDGDELGDDFTIDDVQHVSYQAPNALVALIDREEGAGNYDTLWGHNQRDGGQFAGTRVSEMTINEVLRFADPNGAYGQFVKQDLADKGMDSRVATPMGRYQIVGTTLREIAEAMGLPDDTIFNQKTQDAMFHFRANQRLRGKTGAAARTALRAEWEGFKNASDAELDRAIANFKGMPEPSVASLDRSLGGPSFGDPSGPSAPASRPANGFWTMDQTASSDLTPEARMMNPQDRDRSEDDFDVSQIERGGKVTAQEARKRVIAALMAAGMQDMIPDIVKEEES